MAPPKCTLCQTPAYPDVFPQKSQEKHLSYNKTAQKLFPLAHYIDPTLINRSIAKMPVAHGGSHAGPIQFYLSARNLSDWSITKITRILSPYVANLAEVGEHTLVDPPDTIWSKDPPEWITEAIYLPGTIPEFGRHMVLDPGAKMDRGYFFHRPCLEILINLCMGRELNAEISVEDWHQLNKWAFIATIFSFGDWKCPFQPEDQDLSDTEVDAESLLWNKNLIPALKQMIEAGDFRHQFDNKDLTQCPPVAESDFFTTLPWEINYQILSNLDDYQDLANLWKVSRHFKEFLDDPRFWSCRMRTHSLDYMPEIHHIINDESIHENFDVFGLIAWADLASHPRRQASQACNVLQARQMILKRSKRIVERYHQFAVVPLCYHEDPTARYTKEYVLFHTLQPVTARATRARTSYSINCLPNLLPDMQKGLTELQVSSDPGRPMMKLIRRNVKISGPGTATGHDGGKVLTTTHILFKTGWDDILPNALIGDINTVRSVSIYGDWLSRRLVYGDFDNGSAPAFGYYLLSEHLPISHISQHLVPDPRDTKRSITIGFSLSIDGTDDRITWTENPLSQYAWRYPPGHPGYQQLLWYERELTLEPQTRAPIRPWEYIKASQRPKPYRMEAICIDEWVRDGAVLRSGDSYTTLPTTWKLFLRITQSGRYAVLGIQLVGDENFKDAYMVVTKEEATNWPKDRIWQVTIDPRTCRQITVRGNTSFTVCVQGIKHGFGYHEGINTSLYHRVGIWVHSYSITRFCGFAMSVDVDDSLIPADTKFAPEQDPEGRQGMSIFVLKARMEL